MTASGVASLLNARTVPQRSSPEHRWEVVGAANASVDDVMRIRDKLAAEFGLAPYEP